MIEQDSTLSAASPDPAPIRVALVDDHPTLLRGIKDLLNEDERYEVVGLGSAADDVVTLGNQLEPDVMVVDLSMPGDVFTAIKQVTRSLPTRVVVFTAYGEVDLAIRAFDAGAHGFVLKGRPSEELGVAIESVRRREVFVSPEFSKKLVATLRNRTRGEQALGNTRLSAREKQLVEGLLRGKSNKEIARALELSEKTIKHYMTNLMNKLGVKNRVEVVLAVQNNQTLERSWDDSV